MIKTEKEINEIITDVIRVLHKHKTSKFQMLRVLESVKLVVFVDIDKNGDK